MSCTSPANCTAVGATGVSGQNEVPVAEHWNGSTWAIHATPLPSGALAGALNAVSCPTAGACTAAGWFSDSIARTAGHTALAEFWNGTAWSVQQTAQPPSRKTFNAISCVAARTCTAVGVTVVKTSTFIQPLAEHE